MKFLLDADCPRAIADILKKSGHQVQDIRDVKPETSDQEIYELIKRESLILITRDTDFSNILRYPPTRHCGIILLRVHLLSIGEILAIVGNLIASIPEGELLGSLTVARKDRYRIHRMF